MRKVLLAVAVFLGLSSVAWAQPYERSKHFTTRADYYAQRLPLATNLFHLRMKSLQRYAYTRHEEGTNQWVQSSIQLLTENANDTDSWLRADENDRCVSQYVANTWSGTFPVSVGHVAYDYTMPATNGVTCHVTLVQTNVVELVVGPTLTNPQRFQITWLVRDVNAFGELSESTREIAELHWCEPNSVTQVQQDFGGTNQVQVVAVYCWATGQGLYTQIDPCIELEGRGTEPAIAPWGYGHAGLVPVLESDFGPIRERVEAGVSGLVWPPLPGEAQLNLEDFRYYRESAIEPSARWLRSARYCEPGDGFWEQGFRGISYAFGRAVRWGIAGVYLDLGTYASANDEIAVPKMITCLQPTTDADRMAAARVWHRNVATRVMTTNDLPDYVMLVGSTERIVQVSRGRQGQAVLEESDCTRSYVGGAVTWTTVSKGLKWYPTEGGMYGLPGFVEPWGPHTDYMFFKPTIGAGAIVDNSDAFQADTNLVGVCKDRAVLVSKMRLVKQSAGGPGTYLVQMRYRQYDGSGADIPYATGEVQTATWTLTVPQNGAAFIPDPAPNWRLIGLSVECTGGGPPGYVQQDPLIDEY